MILGAHIFRRRSALEFVVTWTIQTTFATSMSRLPVVISYMTTAIPALTHPTQSQRVITSEDRSQKVIPKANPTHYEANAITNSSTAAFNPLTGSATALCLGFSVWLNVTTTVDITNTAIATMNVQTTNSW